MDFFVYLRYYLPRKFLSADMSAAMLHETFDGTTYVGWRVVAYKIANYELR